MIFILGFCLWDAIWDAGTHAKGAKRNKHALLLEFARICDFFVATAVGKQLRAAAGLSGPGNLYIDS